MIRFLIKGLLRDKSRSRLPIIVVAIGVMLTVFMHAYITGFMGDTIEMNARFTHGHVKVMTKAYAENMDQNPNDLALLDVDELLNDLDKNYSSMTWVPRIQFGGLIDAPDADGETREQGPAFGLAIDFLSEGSVEVQRLNIEKSLVSGSLVDEPDEALLSDMFAQKLNVDVGDEVTFIGSTMYGSMAFYNFEVAGTVLFGTEQLDRGTVLVDIEDARMALNMENAAGEIVGFFDDGFYNNDEATVVAENFNTEYASNNNEYAPVMKTLSEQGSMGQYVMLAEVWTVYISMIFVLAMALVLWNAGLLGGLRRYGEFGIRLAMGEEKKHVYNSLIYESIAVGVIGTVV
ncbi:MAG TPA: FtsX-like permease family protein, partial [Prolixibacteraceae bacterium]|nr:FtsX-like permease family protein [Prolixibacteraceae bacterium]